VRRRERAEQAIPDREEISFSHDGDRCTFEVLLDEAGIKESALRAIADVVHDIDLKDAKFGRPEAAGIARLLVGIAAAHRDDERRPFVLQVPDWTGLDPAAAAIAVCAGVATLRFHVGMLRLIGACAAVGMFWRLLGPGG
jgi:hypothetical protein